MDEYLKTKGGNREAITEREKKLGVCAGLECLVTYMNSWAIARRQGTNDKLWIDGVRLWEFVEREARVYPVLSVLSANIGGLMKEECARIFARMVEERRHSDGDKEKDGEDAVKGSVINQRGREKCWSNVGRGRAALQELGVREVLGPWSTAGEALTYVCDVLEKYSRREKMGWKRDLA
jgi:hypothetical protein